MLDTTPRQPRIPLLGLCPIGKFVFSHEDAMRQKAALKQRLDEWQVRYVDLDGVLDDGMVRDQKHVDPAVKHFVAQEIDALFLPHCNFGTEGAAAMIARRVGVPTLLWGPRDEAPLADGTRLRDTLCGMFATSKVLRKLHVPFSYIENCRVDERQLQEGLDRFLRAANVAGLFRTGMRIGHVGQRIDFFWTTIINESELLERFNVEIIPLDMVTFIDDVKTRAAAHQADYVREAETFKRNADPGSVTDAQLALIFAVRDRLRELSAEHNLDSLAFQSFPSIVKALGVIPSLAGNYVSESHSFACESDIHGAISNTMLEAAVFNQSGSYLVDVTMRHPDDDNGVLLWHLGAPLSMMRKGERMGMHDPWILKGEYTGLPAFQLREGPITVARFDGDTGEYQLAMGQGHTMDGPRNREQYVWMRVDDWPRWERILIEGPFIHHVAMQYGSYAAALEDACRFIPGLKPVRLERAKQ